MEPKPAEPLHFYRLATTAGARTLDQPDDCVVALRALGESTRARIVGLLIEAPLDVSEISKRVGVSPYNVSKHLRILREAGLLAVEKRGRRLYGLLVKIHHRAAEGSVLDLGCCRFQFESVSAIAEPDAAPSRNRRPVGRPPRLAR